jgi:hypothetical protein
VNARHRNTRHRNTGHHEPVAHDVDVDTSRNKPDEGEPRSPIARAVYAVLRSAHLVVAASLVPGGLVHWISLQHHEVDGGTEGALLLFAIIGALFIVAVDQIGYPLSTPRAFVVTGTISASFVVGAARSSASNEPLAIFAGLHQALFLQTVAIVIVLAFGTVYVAYAGVFGKSAPESSTHGESTRSDVVAIGFAVLAYVGMTLACAVSAWVLRVDPANNAATPVARVVAYVVAAAQILAVLWSWVGSSIFARDYGSARYRAQSRSFERWVLPICIALVLSASAGVIAVGVGPDEQSPQHPSR